MYPIQESTDYKKFKFVRFNRPVDDSNLKNLMDLTKKENRLSYYPIIVDKNYYILDGQHRYLTSRLLKLPVYFIRNPDLAKKDHWEEIIAINRAGKKHGYLDIFDMLVRLKNTKALKIERHVNDLGKFRGHGIHFITDRKKLPLIEALRTNQFDIYKNHEHRIDLMLWFKEKYNYINNHHLRVMSNVMAQSELIRYSEFFKALNSTGFFPESDWSRSVFKHNLIKHYNKLDLKNIKE